MLDLAARVWSMKLELNEAKQLAIAAAASGVGVMRQNGPADKCEEAESRMNNNQMWVTENEHVSSFAVGLPTCVYLIIT